MQLTTAQGLQSEIFVPTAPMPVWTPLTKPLHQCKVAFITAGGIHVKTQKPFNTAGDYSYRPSPRISPPRSSWLRTAGLTTPISTRT